MTLIWADKSAETIVDNIEGLKIGFKNVLINNISVIQDG